VAPSYTVSTLEERAFLRVAAGFEAIKDWPPLLARAHSIERRVDCREVIAGEHLMTRPTIWEQSGLGLSPMIFSIGCWASIACRSQVGALMMLKKCTSQKVPPAQVARARFGRPSSYKPEYVKMAKHAARLGATDADLARIFGVSDATIDNWKAQHPDFLGSSKEGKEEADARVVRSLFQRAIGYSYNAEKIFCDKNGKVTRVPIVEHVPPDVTAQIFWLKNRDPERWRDVQALEHSLGKYIISEKPMSKEAWAKERATVIDAKATEIEPPASHGLPPGKQNKPNCEDK
jgi:hypothetical protein